MQIISNETEEPRNEHTTRVEEGNNKKCIAKPAKCMKEETASMKHAKENNDEEEMSYFEEMPEEYDANDYATFFSTSWYDE